MNESTDFELNLFQANYLLELWKSSVGSKANPYNILRILKKHPHTAMAIEQIENMQGKQFNISKIHI